MTPQYELDGVRIFCGDVREVLPNLESGSINCCVTSPPYWGLRDYGTATWEGGNPECDHKVNSGGKVCQLEGASQRGRSDVAKGDCPRCGAVRHDKQLGLESTPEEYVANMVEVFREVRRVLRDDGTLWLNLGDSYAAGGQNSGSTPEKLTSKQRSNAGCRYERRDAPAGLKPKDLVGIPWAVAFALRADGWYLRSEIIWHKLNPMPESTKDRPTKSHEQIFLMSKSSRYYYNADAIAEPAVHSGESRSFCTAKKLGRVVGRGGPSGNELPGAAPVPINEKKNKRTVWTVEDDRQLLDWLTENSPELVEQFLKQSANKEDVWKIPTEPYPAAHFATFPRKLIEPCILAGCPEGGTVMDPFTGSGTTAEVARKNGCKFVGCEINPEYIELIKDRLQQRQLF